MSTIRRGLQKGKATRTKTGVASPLNTTGIDGDIRIVESAGTPPKLKVRSNGKWWTADLVDETKAQTAGFVPKVWVQSGITRSGAGDQYIYMPSYVTNNNVIAINFSISIGEAERVYWWLGESGDAAVYDMYVFFNQRNNYVRIEINASGGGDVDGKDFTLAVFYQDRKS